MPGTGFTWRALLIGTVFALLIAGVTYFNDHVIRQTYLTGNQFPVVVFGFAVVILLVVNPLLGLVRREWPLRAGEIAIVTALGLAVCAWPGSNMMRYFSSVTAMPAYLLKTQPNWQASEVFSHFPGGSPRIAPGHVVDTQALSDAINQDTPLALHLRGHWSSTNRSRDAAVLTNAEAYRRNPTE